MNPVSSAPIPTGSRRPTLGSPSGYRPAGATGRRAFLGILCVTFALALAAAAPEPDPVPRRWQLELEIGPMRVVTLDAEGIGPRAYLYLTYKVTNNSGEDLLFAPSFEIATDAGYSIRSGRDVPLEVTRRLVAMVQNQFIQDQVSIIGQILQGPENAKEGLVVWPAKDLKSDEIALYAAGFSGETATVLPPGGKNKVVLRKTFMVRYSVPGTLEGQGSDPLQPIERRWIMR